MPHTGSNDPHSTMYELRAALPLTSSPSPSERTLTDSRSSEKAYQKSSSKPERQFRASELRFLWPDGKETPEEQEARTKENLRRSAILASLLNLDLERGQARRIAAGQRPLMPLTIPDDFRCVPRIFAYILDDALRKRLAEISHSCFDIPEDPGRTLLQYLTYGMRAVEQRLRIRLEVEFAAHKLPASREDEFLVLVIVFASNHRQQPHRPTEWQVNELSKAFRQQPQWLIHASTTF